MSHRCPLCEHPDIDQWDLCRSIEESRGAAEDVPSFVRVKRDVEAEYDVETTTTALKRHIQEDVDVPAAGVCLLRARLYTDVYDTALAGVSRDPPDELAEVLPQRPLTGSEVAVLASHPEIEAVHGEPLDSWYSELPDDFEDDIHTLWIEVGDDEVGEKLITYSFRIEGIGKFDEYSPSMDFARAMDWERTEVRTREDLLDSGMLFRDDYVHVPERESTETVEPSFSGHRGFASGTPLDLEDVRDLSTEEIVRWLDRFGVEFTEDRFRTEVRDYHSASELADHWWDTYDITATGYDEDFIWMAALVLWERLEPEGTNSEQLDRTMQEG